LYAAALTAQPSTTILLLPSSFHSLFRQTFCYDCLFSRLLQHLLLALSKCLHCLVALWGVMGRGGGGGGGGVWDQVAALDGVGAGGGAETAE
jgi:hypothetical protein